MSNFTEICPVGAKMFHEDGQDRHNEANMRFSHFWNCAEYE